MLYDRMIHLLERGLWLECSRDGRECNLVRPTDPAETYIVSPLLAERARTAGRLEKVITTSKAITWVIKK